MTHESLINRDWQATVDRLGGAERIEASAKKTRAFVRARGISNAVDLLRIVLAYCLGGGGLRSTAAWAASIGFADISNVAVLYRLQQCSDWLTMLIGHLLAQAAPKPSGGRLIRVIDGSAVAQAGTLAKRNNGVWRIHSAFDLPSERFGHFELTDERGGERLDRIPVIKGEIRLADRAYLQPDRIAAVLDGGGDVVVRAGWKSARWLDESGALLDLVDVLRAGKACGLIDQPIWLARRSAPALNLRLVAVKKPPQAAEIARRKARQAARKGGHGISKRTLEAADWVIIITSLASECFSTEDVLALYRLRWRIELGFKRLKSVVGLRAPPGNDERSARVYILAHLLMILLLEPVIDEFEDSPHWAQAA
jgi:DDE family transposase